MKALLSGIAVLGLVGTLSHVARDTAPGPAARPQTAPVSRSAPPPASFTLARAGNEVRCAITKGAALARGRAALTASGDCVAVLPELARVRYWQETEKDTVAFLAENGRTVAEFFVSDGMAYESLKPTPALLSLTARNRQ